MACFEHSFNPLPLIQLPVTFGYSFAYGYHFLNLQGTTKLLSLCFPM
jgi:hypothetical protein